MDVDVLLLEEARLDAVDRCARLDERPGRLDALVHHFAEFAGGLHLTLAGHGHRLDGQ